MQARQVLGEQVVAGVDRHDQVVALREQPTQLRPERSVEPGERDHPGSAAGARRPEGRAVGRVAEQVDRVGGVPLALGGHPQP